MNERIKELFAQSEIYYYSSTGDLTSGHSITDLEKLAELIVAECVTQCSKVLVEYTGQPSVTHNYAVGLCQDRIKEHFGVEE